MSAWNLSFEATGACRTFISSRRVVKVGHFEELQALSENQRGRSNDSTARGRNDRGGELGQKTSK